jgi:hypothetical protein
MSAAVSHYAPAAEVAPAARTYYRGEAYGIQQEIGALQLPLAKIIKKY